MFRPWCIDPKYLNWSLLLAVLWVEFQWGMPVSNVRTHKVQSDEFVENALKYDYHIVIIDYYTSKRIWYCAEIAAKNCQLQRHSIKTRDAQASSEVPRQMPSL